MKRHLTWMLAIAAASAVSVAGVAWASDSTGANFSTLKMKAKSTSLFVETSTQSNTNPGTPTNPGNIPFASNNVKLTLPNGVGITTKGLPQCTKSLENTTTATAMQLCGQKNKKSYVGSGQATACIGQANTPCTGLGNPNHFVVTAFNGKPKGGKPTLILHSRDDNLGTGLTTVLTGTYDPNKNTLNVPIPPEVYNVATITDFQTTVQRKFTVNGKTKQYLKAKCKGGKWTLKGEFKYQGGDPTDKPSVSQKC